jgi:hypothetical protein
LLKPEFGTEPAPEPEARGLSSSVETAEEDEPALPEVEAFEVAAFELVFERLVLVGVGIGFVPVESLLLFAGVLEAEPAPELEGVLLFPLWLEVGPAGCVVGCVAD